MAKKLYGIGVGVGEPGLVTLKAVEVLKKVDYICTPMSAKSDSSKALKIISNLIELKGKIVKLNFKMSKSRKELEQSRTAAAQKIYKLLKKDKKIAFVTIGDPFLYSTYSYMLKKISEWDRLIEIETIPGINSIAAATSRYNLPLAEEKENTAILSNIKSEDHLEKVFNLFETVVILKLSRNYKAAYRVLEKLGLKKNVLIASKCGFEDEFYTENIEVFKNKKIEYLTLMIVKRKGIY